MSQFRSKQFKSLQSQWYSKLKEAGFSDIEDTSSSQEFIKEWHSLYFQKRNTPDTFQARRQYFDQALSFLHTHRFASDQDKRVWELHCEGLSLRQIVTQLDLKLWVVHTTVEYLKAQIKWSLVLLG